jgi:hypothetical protein
MAESHRPLVCKLAETWQTAAREDEGTAQWIKANTRCCPKCKNNIEKGGGCKYGYALSITMRIELSFLGAAAVG